MSGRTIDPTITTPGGTRVKLNDDTLSIERPVAPVRRPTPAYEPAAAAVDAAGRGDFKAAEVRLQRLDLAMRDGELTEQERYEAAEALLYVSERALAAPRQEVSFLQMLLYYLTFTLVAPDEDHAAKVAEVTARLRERLGVEARALAQPGDGDISQNMNLLVHNPLAHTTRDLARGLGEPFVPIHDRVTSYHLSEYGKIDTGDFERTSGLRLVDRGSRNLVSQIGDSLYCLTWDGAPAFRGEDGQVYLKKTDDLFLRPTPVLVDGRSVVLADDGTLSLSGHPSVALPKDAEGRLERHLVEEDNVVARPWMPGDPPARAHMAYNWRNLGTQATLDVSWWGMCESSSMLGSLGVMPARSPVALVDEASGKRVDLSAEDVTNIMVFLARGSFLSMATAAEAGNNNETTHDVDGDSPAEFHAFVEKQISLGLPFNIDASSGSQMWNTPIHHAAIERSGPRRRFAKGESAQTYVMTLTASDGSRRRYTYEIRYDARGAVQSSSWDLTACHRDNGSDPVPDYMWSFFGSARRRVELSAGRSTAQVEGWTPEAVRIVGDLYFASLRRADPGDSRVYVVRRRDGRLEQLTRQEYESMRRRPTHAAAASGS